MSADKIRSALAKLDPEQDPHWTKDGEPAVSFVNIYSGGKHTREDIVQAWPGFTRSTAKEMVAQGYSGDAGATGEPAPAATPSTPPAAPVQATAAEPTVATNANEAAEQESDSVDAKLLELRKELHQVEQYMHQASQRKHDLQKAMDAILVKRKESDSFQDANAGYLARQQEVLKQRGEQMQRVRDAGITRKMLDEVIPKPAPIDRALKNRRNT